MTTVDWLQAIDDSHYTGLLSDMRIAYRQDFSMAIDLSMHLPSERILLSFGNKATKGGLDTQVYTSMRWASFVYCGGMMMFVLLL